ncbi:MAG: hypothetical protein L6Q99_21250 [Planctomycetes bacterium]|nr:hypothetical protein [Planctomycetota bacterium]
MAASLACTALERRSAKIMNVDVAAMSTILLGSAFEALHCRGAETHHSHREVWCGVERLDPANTRLGERVLAGVRPRGVPLALDGDELSRPMFVAAQLIYVRNQFAHGKIPPNPLFSLPSVLNNANLIHAATSVLAAVLGDDISRLVECVVPERTSDELSVVNRLGLGFDPVHAALVDGRTLLQSLERMLVPESEGAA